MANNLLSNPVRVDTAGVIIWDPKGDTLFQALQWVDDDSAAGGNIADGDNLNIILNGVQMNLNCKVAESLSGSIVYGINFSIPVRTFQLEVTAISGGTLLIWKA